MRRVLLATIMISLLLSVAACKSGKQEEAAPPPTTPASAGESAVKSTPTKAAQAPAAATPTQVPPTPTVEVEPTLSADQLAALDQLKSFRSKTVFSYEGVDDQGNPDSTSAEVNSEYVRDPLARHLVMTITSSDDEDQRPQTIEIYESEGKVYMKADDRWLSISSDQSPFGDPDIQFLVNTGSIFSNPQDFKRVRPDEKVNGIDSRRYEFDEKAIAKYLDAASDQDVDLKGQVWIAKDGGFVTRYEFTMDVKQGGAGMLAPSLAQGTVTMQFELSDVNEDITVELPAEAEQTLSMAGFDADNPFPVPENSKIAMASAELTMVQTALTPADVVAFYDQALADMGWTKNEEQSMSMGDMASLQFTKDKYVLELIVAADTQNPGQTQVMANVQQP